MPILSYLKALNRALGAEMERDPAVCVLGEDIGVAVSNVTNGLLKRFGPDFRRESLIGDLFEEYQRERSRAWYWKETGMALLHALGTRVPKFVLNVVLRVLIEIGIILGGIALAQSNVPPHHVPTATHAEHVR